MVLKTLTDRGLILKKGTIVDSTIISAPSSTKNKEKKRDPDAHSVKKGTAWYFGYKAHIGVDKDSGLVHHVEVTSANVHDVEMTPKLMTGDESEIYGDSGYIGAEKRQDAIIRNRQGKKIRYKQNRKPTQIKKLSASGQWKAKKAEHQKSSVRAKVEHVFAVIKGQFHFSTQRPFSGQDEGLFQPHKAADNLLRERRTHQCTAFFHAQGRDWDEYGGSGHDFHHAAIFPARNVRAKRSAA